MGTVLVIGATGFVGRRLALTLRSEGWNVRCLVRTASKASELKEAGCEIVAGDILDPASLEVALSSVEAVYVSVHTLSKQKASSGKNADFMDIEMQGLQNIVAACKKKDVHRIIYLTALGSAPDAKSSWARGRFKTEQMLVASGLNATVIRPGLIVGRGGNGFEMMLSQAKKRVTPVLGRGDKKMRSIAVDDLVYYMIGVRDEAQSFNRIYDVGSDDVMTGNETIDALSTVLGRNRSYKVHLPIGLIRPLAPLIERIAHLPAEAVSGLLDGIATDLLGDPFPIRVFLPRKPVGFHQAAKLALKL